MATEEATLSGTVTAKSTGDPLSGISVAIFNDSTNQKLTGKTDSSGAYSIQSIPVGTYNVEVEGDDYAPTNLDDLSLPAGNTTRNFTMSKSSSIPGMESPTKLRITGTVVSAEMSVTVDGETKVTSTTVAGATVTVTNVETGAVLGTTTSADDGTFSIEFPMVNSSISAEKGGESCGIVDMNEVGIAADGEVIPGVSA